MSNRNPILDRALITYPHPKYHKLFIAECHANSAGKSETLEKIIREHYDNMSEGNRQGLLTLWEEMTPEQRKNPKV